MFNSKSTYHSLLERSDNNYQKYRMAFKIDLKTNVDH